MIQFLLVLLQIFPKLADICKGRSWYSMAPSPQENKVPVYFARNKICQSRRVPPKFLNLYASIGKDPKSLIAVLACPKIIFGPCSECFILYFLRVLTFLNHQKVCLKWLEVLKLLSQRAVAVPGQDLHMGV